MPIRFASEAWPRPGLAEPRLQALEIRQLFHQQNRKGKIVMIKASRYIGLVLGSFLVPQTDMIFGDGVGASLVACSVACSVAWVLRVVCSVGDALNVLVTYSPSQDKTMPTRQSHRTSNPPKKITKKTKTNSGRKTHHQTRRRETKEEKLNKKEAPGGAESLHFPCQMFQHQTTQ